MPHVNKDHLPDLYSKGYRVQADGSVVGLRGRKLKLFVSGGYHAFGVRVGRFTFAFVHCLAAYQKYGEDYLKERVVARHLNNDRLDNRLCNIAIGTESDNAQDSIECVRRRARKAARSQRKLSDEQVAQLVRDRASGAKYSELCRKYRISKSTVSYILNQKTYADVTQLAEVPVSRTGS